MKQRVVSIKRRLSFSYVFIIIVMIIPTLYSIVVSKYHTNQYDKIITNVSSANRLSQIVKTEITDEVWNIVSGRVEFKDGKQYEILGEIKTIISDIISSTENEKNKQILIITNRAVNTLEDYINILGEQIKNNSPVEENEKTMDEIRGVSSLVYDILQSFIVSEIESASYTNESIKKSSINLTIIQISIALIIVIISIYTSFYVSENIRRPIHDMELLSSKIASGNLQARANKPNVEELDNLAVNLNVMAGKIQILIDENIKEQKNLQKAEMKTLQAQITPHFLYNTFDTIIWLAESKQADEVIDITRALSDFFRISLSKGHEWITVEQEVNHVKNYLKIQKIRYENILTYEFNVDEGLENIPVLKLVLQPLVENALYHGIKNKRGRGKITVSAHLLNNDDVSQNKIIFSVQDNGIGFTNERLKEVKSELR